MILNNLKITENPDLQHFSQPILSTNFPPSQLSATIPLVIGLCQLLSTIVSKFTFVATQRGMSTFLYFYAIPNSLFRVCSSDSQYQSTNF